MTRHCLTSLSFNLYSTQCLCFWILRKDFKCFKTVVWSTTNHSASSSCTWHEFSGINTSNSSSSKFFGMSERFFLFLRVFGLLSSSLLLYSQCFDQYVLWLSSGVCRTQEPAWNFKPCPLFNLGGGSLVMILLTITSYMCEVFLYCYYLQSGLNLQLPDDCLF